MRSLKIKVHLTYLAVALASLSGGQATQTNVLLTNDDGWAVANIRAFNTALKAAGFNVVLSAPSINKSGTGSSDAVAPVVGPNGCEFSSCPAGSPPEGFNASDTRLNYVNSFPVTSVRYGIQTLSPKFFRGKKPDIVVSGPNVGNNLGNVTTNSGTVGAATEAAKEGVPAIAFSGQGGAQISYSSLSTPSNTTTTANVFGEVATTFTRELLATPFNRFAPILPANISLNVNFPNTTGPCAKASAFRFVLTRIFAANDTTPPDVRTCGSNRLPTEASVVAGGGCLASVSVMNAVTKLDVSEPLQSFVLRKLSRVLVCASEAKPKTPPKRPGFPFIP